MSDLDKAVGLANESAGGHKETMKSKITYKIPKLKNKVSAFHEQIRDGKFLDVNSNMYNILNEIE